MERNNGGHSFTASHLSRLVMEGDPSLSSSRLDLIHQMLMEGREEPIAAQERPGRYSPFVPDQRSRADTTRQRNLESQRRQTSNNFVGSNWNFDIANDMFDSSNDQEGSSSNAVTNWRDMNSLTASIMHSDSRLPTEVSLSRNSSYQGELDSWSEGLECE